MADTREIAGWRQAYRNYSDEDLIRVMREKVSYCSEHIAAEQELHSRTKAATEEARKQSQGAESDIERRHREQLEASQAALQVTIRHHQETMAHDHQIVDRQLSAARRSSWTAAVIAFLSMLAGWASIWYAHRAVDSAAQLESRVALVEQHLAATPTPAPATTPPPAPQLQSTPTLQPAPTNANTPATTTPQAATPAPKTPP